MAKHKVEDVGYKMKNDGMPTTSESNKDKMSYPKMRFDNKIPSSAKEKDVGDKCKFYGEGEISSKSQDEYGESITVEVHKIGFYDNDVSDEDYKKMSDDDKDKADEKDVMEDK